MGVNQFSGVDTDLGNHKFGSEQTDAVDVFLGSLSVTIHATILRVDVIERGNDIVFIASFAGDPDSVYFSYTRPQENRPVVDPGFDRRGSAIMRIQEGVYLIDVDTTGFRGGRLRWHFWGEGSYKASQFGEVYIRDRPVQLG